MKRNTGKLGWNISFYVILEINRKIIFLNFMMTDIGGVGSVGGQSKCTNNKQVILFFGESLVKEIQMFGQLCLIQDERELWRRFN